MQVSEVVGAIAQLDAFSSLQVPLSLLDVVLGEGFLDCRGITERDVSREGAAKPRSSFVQKLAHKAKVAWACGE